METIPCEIVSAITGYLDVASACTFEHVIYKTPFQRMNVTEIVDGGLEFFKLWTRYVDPNFVCSVAATYGTFSMFAWAYSRFPADHTHCLVEAIKRNNLKIVQMVIKKAAPLCCYDGMITSIAAKHARLGILILLHKYGMVFNSDAYAQAAQCNRIDVLDWLYSINCSMSNVIIPHAVDGGKEAVDWCHEMGCEWNWITWSIVVENRDISMIEHLISLGYNKTGLPEAIYESNDPDLLAWEIKHLQ